jgi:hypothetical protein
MIPGFDAPRLTNMELRGIWITLQEYSILSSGTPNVISLILHEVRFVDEGPNLHSVAFHHTCLQSLTVKGQCETKFRNWSTSLSGILRKIIASTNHLTKMQIDPLLRWPALRTFGLSDLELAAKPTVKCLGIMMTGGGRHWRDTAHRFPEKAVLWLDFFPV